MNNIKLIIFDFDGTLCDCVEVHYQALNMALTDVVGSDWCISREDQDKTYNGLSTKTKLNLLFKNSSISDEKIKEIAKLKQEYTLTAINNQISANSLLKNSLESLKKDGYKIACASNALKETVILGLSCLGVLDLFDAVVGNDEIKNQKPFPEIFLKCFIDFGVSPKECVIVEDSAHGRQAALASGAFLCEVNNPSQTTYERISSFISSIKTKNKFYGRSTLKVLIPMAGSGSRFAKVGYTLPKPLIDVKGKPMIQRVIENLNIDAQYIFIVQKEHYQKYNLGTYLDLLVPGCKIVQTDGLTEGAACTALLAEEFIDSNGLVIANSDQFVEWDSSSFLFDAINKNVDGSIVTFTDTNPKWSFVKIGEDGFVNEIAEKKPISDKPTVGIYYWKNGRDFVESAKSNIKENKRVNNEFYICPTYEVMITAGAKISAFDCEKMWGLGTPEDLEYFLQNFKGLED